MSLLSRSKSRLVSFRNAPHRFCVFHHLRADARHPLTCLHGSSRSERYMYTRRLSQNSPRNDNVYSQSSGASTAPKDCIRIRDLTLLISFDDGAQWSADGGTLQPVHISLSLAHDIRRTATTDDLSHSISYAEVLDNITRDCTSSSVSSIEALADRIWKTCSILHPELEECAIRISRPKGSLYAKSTGLETIRLRYGQEQCRTYFVEDLECFTIVGINTCEREQQQRARFNISITDSIIGDEPFDVRNLTHVLAEHIHSSSCLTLEALSSTVANKTLEHVGNRADSVSVRAAKPCALPLAEAAEVEITRTRDDFQHRRDAAPVRSHAAVRPPFSLQLLLASLPAYAEIYSPQLKHKAAIALGANLGDRFANIELALRLLEAPGGDLINGTGPPRAAVIDTSFMYETAPMYVTDQPKFINCACIVETDMTPRELLDFVKEIETTVGRVTSFRNGPRAIDLDILTYDSIVSDSRPESERATLDNLAGDLVLPHPRIVEREFVLRPLQDMIPQYIHPTSGKSIKTLFTELLARPLSDTAPMSKVMPFPRYPLPDQPTQRAPSPSLFRISPVPPTATYWMFPADSNSRLPHKTYIMGTLNATPDSFSDGSVNNTVPAAIRYATSSITGGADIIDVGGYSTRPRADYVSPEEEISRVVPIIKAIRSLDMGTPPEEASLASTTSRVPISIDTFRADVAQAAVRAGANCINDVYAFTGPEYPLTSSSAEHFLHMRATARDLAVPVVLMHSRGEASDNKDYSAYAYAADELGRGNVLEAVRIELGEKVEAAVKGRGSLRRWYILVDPGIGFSKTVEGNLELLRHAQTLTAGVDIQYRRANPLAGYPQLIGASRKSFLGTVLERADPDGTYSGRKTRGDERSWATAAAVSCAVQQRAAVVRVHDVRELGDVIRISSALWGLD